MEPKEKIKNRTGISLFPKNKECFYLENSFNSKDAIKF